MRHVIYIRQGRSRSVLDQDGWEVCIGWHSALSFAVTGVLVSISENSQMIYYQKEISVWLYSCKPQRRQFLVSIKIPITPYLSPCPPTYINTIYILTFATHPFAILRVLKLLTLDWRSYHRAFPVLTISRPMYKKHQSTRLVIYSVLHPWYPLLVEPVVSLIKSPRSFSDMLHNLIS